MKTLETVELEKCGPTSGDLIHLPYGLLGFERVKEFKLVTNPHEEPFMWLQMLNDVRKEFLVISPFMVVSNYQPDIAAEDVDFLGITRPEEALVLAIVTLRSNGQGTVNLKGPIVINSDTFVGKQVIPNNVSQFALCHPLPVT